MTHKELGKAIKGMHPEAYGHLPDDVVGKAMDRRFPGVYEIGQPPAGTLLDKVRSQVKQHRAAKPATTNRQ